jgi:DNA-directed RNA polymerase subunit RPC12/RpoP
MKIACPRCGADVSFDPATGMCHCDYCGSNIDMKEFELNQYEKAKAQANEAMESSNGVEAQSIPNGDDIYDEFHCSSCGAKLITDKTTTITRCVFCGSQQMIKQRMTGRFEPKEVIPFKIDKNRFINIYTTFIGKKILAPNEFRHNPHIVETRGLYVPFHTFEYKIKSYGRGLGQYTQDKTTYSQWFEYENEADALVAVDGSTRLDDSIMTSLEPFNWQEVVPFNPAYITGFQSECTDESEEALTDKAQNRAFMHSVKSIKKQLGRYNHKSGLVVSDVTGDNKSKYVLLPTWFVNCFYNNKKYSYAVNGQTGKVVGEVPLSKPKFYSLMSVLVAIALALTLMIIVASAGSSRRSSSDDDGPGGIIVAVWALGVVTPYLAIKKRYKNITHAFDVPLPIKNYRVTKEVKFRSKHDYQKSFPNDNLNGIVYQKYQNGKYICNMDMNRMRKDISALDRNEISINNSNL